MSDEVDPDLLAFAAEARRIEPRIRGLSFRPGDHRTVMLLVLLDAPREVTKRLYDHLKTYREANEVDCDVLITNSTTPKFKGPIEIPKGWPPE